MKEQLKRISVEQLNRYSATYRICCMGCGKRMYEMLDAYAKESFIKSISCFIDNDSALWGKPVQIGNSSYLITGRELLSKKDEENLIILITSDSYRNIYDSIKETVKTKNIKTYIYPLYYRRITGILLRFFSCFIDDRRLLFYAGNEPHENTDAILDYLDEYNGKSFKPVCIGDCKASHKNVIQINKSDICKRGTIRAVIRYCFYYASSKYLFYENEALEKVGGKQILIYLNHGTIPLKKVSDVLRQKPEMDYGICPSEGCAMFYIEQYGIPTEKHLYMMPARINYLYDKEVIVPWKRNDEKLILWLPTFRQLEGTMRKDSMHEKLLDIIPSDKEWQIMNQMLKTRNQVLLIKKHPREKIVFCLENKYSNIISITDEDLQENHMNLNQLLSKTDALLTDYSGIAFEFMLLNRPIGYIINDMDDYVRGFSVERPLEYMPGNKIRNIDELIQFLDDVFNMQDVYAQERNQLVVKLFQNKIYEDGAKALINKIVKGEI